MNETNFSNSKVAQTPIAEGPQPVRYSLRTIILFVSVLCALLTLVGLVFTTIGRVRKSIENEYVLSEVVEMISLYYGTNGNTFPTKWDDLSAAYKVVDQGYSLGPDGLKKLERQVWLNFDLLSDNTRLKQLLGNSEVAPTLVFIRLRDNRDPMVLTTVEKWANERIERFVRRALFDKDGAKPPRSGDSLNL